MIKFIIFDILLLIGDVYMILLSKNLATRESANNLFKKLLNNSDNKLDFSNVEVVSRSFANEFMNLEKKNLITFRKYNMKPEVKYIFDNALKELDSNLLEKNNFDVVSVKKYASLI